MAEPTLTSVFGANSTQNTTDLVIKKSDLAAVGLTASAANNAESLFVAILLLAKQTLTQTNFDTNIDQSIYIDTGFPSFTSRGTNNDSYRVDQFTLNLAKPDTSGTIDPDDY
jgi:hypothetical protein